MTLVSWLDIIMKKLSCTIFLLFAILLSGCAGTAASTPTSAASATSAPKAVPVPGIVTATGNVVPVEKSDMSFVISGPVKEVDVAEGDQVKAGQTLMVLDTPDLAYDVTGAEAALRSAQDFAFLQHYARKTLIGSNFVSANGAPELRQVADVKVVQAQAALTAAQAALAQGTLLAPYDGTVVSLNVTPGELVQPGEVVATIGVLTHLQVETKDLSERDIAAVQAGQAATIRLKSFNQDLTGRVIMIAQMSNVYNGDNVYKVTIQLDTQPAGLLWGMSGDVEIKTK
jgi:membrane fusion protein, multidrug efflux system